MWVRSAIPLTVSWLIGSLIVPSPLAEGFEVGRSHPVLGGGRASEDGNQAIGYLRRRTGSQGREAAQLHEEEIEYTIGVFGTEYNLKFQQNKKLLPSEGFQMQWRNSSGLTFTEMDPAMAQCHYIHRDIQSVAALSDCGFGQIRGFVSTPNETFEITPLTDELEALFLRDPSLLGFDDDIADSIVIEDLYLVKRAKLPALEDDDELLLWENEVENGFSTYKLRKSAPRRDPRTENPDSDLVTETTDKVVELGIFMDVHAYENLNSLHSPEEMMHIVLASVNQVDAIYHLASLRQNVGFAIKVLEVQTESPPELASTSGERREMLDSFCEFNTKLNDPENGSPSHWDLGVYLTGLDLYHADWGYEEYDTLGLTRTGAMCHPKFSCLITEFGVVPKNDTDSPPETTAGFGAVYVIAHEIGHSLGMSHDGSRNDCPRNGFIMSSSRGNDGGETRWSNCSASSLLSSKATYCLNNSPNLEDENAFRFDMDDPGKIYEADFQCQTFLRDQTGMAIKDDKDMCSTLKCTRPSSPRPFPSGPALDGTHCGSNGMCNAGECLEPATTYGLQSSPWRRGLCTSGCIKRSQGSRSNTRICRGDPSQRPCEDLAIEFCPDNEMCLAEGPRQSRDRFATRRCDKFAADPKVYPTLEGSSALSVRGMPAIYSPTSPHQACLIFCKFDAPSAPRLGRWNTPLKTLGMYGRETEAYFPDGTWCHRLNGTDFYCVNHECVSPDSSDKAADLGVEAEKLL